MVARSRRTTILGIAFNGPTVETYYDDGRLNESSTSLNLAQP